jgi:penicillin amidase/acyl-homoserine-lactone acylase
MAKLCFWSACAAGVVLCLLAGCRADRSAYIPPAGKYDVRILRDTWGVPHIFGKRDVDTAYGLGWAQAEDDWANVEDAVLLAHGRLASVRGRNFAPFDYLFQLFRVRQFVEQRYESDLSPEVRAICEAYAEGINHFAALNPEKMPDLPLPVTGKDIVAGAAFKSPFFYDLQSTLETLFQEGTLIGDKGEKVARLPDFSLLFPGEALGSNAFAIAPKRSADGCTRIAINSHQPWTGPVAWYEAHCHSEEGWNMVGGTFPGAPMIFKGHDANKAWCHTINRPDLADVYRLEMNPDNPDQYRFDGAWKTLEKGTARITVDLWGPFYWTVGKEMLWSVHGPVIRREDGCYALRFVGYGEIAMFEQWWRMNKARNMEEFMAAMRTQRLLSLNTLYADREGNVFYVYNGRFPKREAGHDWRGVLPGDTSKTVWTEFHPFETLPQIARPASGFIQTCNNSPYHSTDGPDNPRPESFPEEMGLETYMTNRGLRALETYGADDSITREEFYSYKFDKAYSQRSAVAEYRQRVLAMTPPPGAVYAAGMRLLRDWDLKTTPENRQAALAVLASEDYARWRRFGGANEPDLMAGFVAACDHLQRHFGRLDPPWGEVMRLRRGRLDLPLGGGPDCLRALDHARDPDGRLRGINGDCYFLMVEWSPTGALRSEAIHQFGAATLDEQSPHYADQAPLFAKEQLRPTLLEETEICRHLSLEYRPGAFRGAWHRKPKTQ